MTDEELLKLFKDGSAGGAAATSTGPRVYFGKSFTYDRSDRTTTKTPSDDTDSVDGGISRWYQMSDQERASIGVRLARAGVLDSASDYQGAFKAWQYAVQEAGNFYTATGGKRKVTPWDMLSLLEDNAAAAGGSKGPKTTKQTSTSTNIPSPLDAEAAVKTIFQEGIGRDPSKGELARYSSLLIGKAKANPSITNSTQTVDANGNVSQSSTSSGGLSAAGAQQALMNEVQADPEYGSYQAATTYYGALLKAIAAPA